MANKYIALLLVFLVVAVAVEAKELSYEEYKVVCGRRCYAGCPSIAYICKKWCNAACKVQLYTTDSMTDAGPKYPVPTKEDLEKYEKELASLPEGSEVPVKISGRAGQGTGI